MIIGICNIVHNKSSISQCYPNHIRMYPKICPKIFQFFPIICPKQYKDIPMLSQVRPNLGESQANLGQMYPVVSNASQTRAECKPNVSQVLAQCLPNVSQTRAECLPNAGLNICQMYA